MSTHVVVGAGPVGSGIALALAERGERVAVVTRSGSGPQHANIQHIAADASDSPTLTKMTEGAATIFNCANPPYHRWATDWPPMHRSFIQAAEATGAVLVMMDNLYALGKTSTMPMKEDSPMRATGTKGTIRASMASDLLEAHATGRIRATLARASDFFGPGVRNAALGERVIPKILAGKKVSLLGSLDVAHSSSYMPDVVRTMVAIGTDQRAWGSAWQVPNAPAVTQRQMVETFAEAAGTKPKVGVVPFPMLKVLGLFVPVMRELQETWYQFDEPFVTDSSLTERTFGVSATPLHEAAAATVAWWRTQAP
jgi:nucleoside-diphosphate-sugar epimerase